MKRCSWVNLNNPLYVKYHDEEWCVPKFKDHELFELLILEMFQAGLSWETILNKRDSFKTAFDDFHLEKIIEYDEAKIEALMSNPKIVRNRRKIMATINNAKIFKQIQKEYGNFSNYIWKFTDKEVVRYETPNTSNELSDTVSKDLQRRGMTFVGTTIIYSYLQAVGIIDDHEKQCFLYKKMEGRNE